MRSKSKSKMMEEQLQEILKSRPALEAEEQEEPPTFVPHVQDEKLKQKYINLVKLFPDKDLEEYNEGWSDEELKQKIQSNKKKIMGGGENLINSDINKTILKASSGLVEKGLSKYIDIEGLSNNISSNKTINDSTSLIIGDLLEDFLIINSSNPYFSLMVQLIIEIIKTVFVNKSNKHMMSKLNNIEEQYKRLYQERQTSSTEEPIHVVG